jgi:hypothetical protein
MAAEILPFLKETSFDAEATRIMGEAFNIARKHMHDNGQPDVVLEIIANASSRSCGMANVNRHTLPRRP